MHPLPGLTTPYFNIYLLTTSVNAKYYLLTFIQFQLIYRLLPNHCILG